jgi:hypothetical protein
LEGVKLQGARFIEDPKSVALTIINETDYEISAIVFMFVFRGGDFTEIIENIHCDFNAPLAGYEKRFTRVDLSGTQFQTPESFSLTAVVQSITTSDGKIIIEDQQTSSSYSQGD